MTISSERINELRQVGAFSELSDDQLRWFLERSEERCFAAGETVTMIGDEANTLTVVLEGTMQGHRRENGSDTFVYMVEKGSVTGALPFSRMKIFPATTRTVVPTRLLLFPRALFPEMYVELPELIPKLVGILTDRVRETAKTITQHEKLASLGKLSAGLAHELNNPASAARQASLSARRAFEQFQAASDGFLSVRPTDTFLKEVVALEAAAAAGIRDAPTLDTLTRSDREEAMGDYLQELGVAEPWDLAAAFVDAGLVREELERRTVDWAHDCRAFGLQRVAAAIQMEQVLAQMLTATTRIADLVKAIKDYSYMDRAALAEIDLHHSLDTTLRMFSFRFKEGVRVETDYDPHLPRICAQGGQLNQVWTNLIDNAIDAMLNYQERQGPACLKVRTRVEVDYAVVEFADNGSGIPEAIATKVYDPFFTTKPQGSGTGLGLDTVYRIIHQHYGTIDFESQPGNTVFTIRLPLQPPA
ncbi:MAG: cyclic nucleotide-binding domain-containing protein [Bryobacteraceae bacterium]|nr:cyclic nucleotide-binding domain-containing protein [Bryobacteraceae bacterium]